MSTFDGFTFEDSVVNVKAADSVVVMVSPDTKEAMMWGVYQFPKIWRASEGNELYLQVFVGQDTYGRIGMQSKPLYYRSDDIGHTWKQIQDEEVDFLPDIISLPDGEYIRIGKTRSEPELNEEKISLENLKSVEEHLSPNVVGGFAFYKYGDIPEKFRKFPLARKKTNKTEWIEEGGIINFPELLVGAVVKSRLSRESELEWEAITPVIRKPRPIRIAVSKEGTLFSNISGQLAGHEKYFEVLYCIASTDGGKTWNYRGTIADQTELSTWGYSGSENAMITEDNGDLICAMRADLCGMSDEDTTATMLSRSTDKGYTWSKPVPVAPYSVTPHLVQLANRITVLIYGRPGVHLLFSTDCCRTWHTPHRVIGRLTKAELQEEAQRGGGSVYVYGLCIQHDTCANTSFVKTGDDRFLIAYSDFNFQDENGKNRKAIKVQEFTITQ
jgi:hypothetical protein